MQELLQNFSRKMSTQFSMTVDKDRKGSLDPLEAFERAAGQMLMSADQSIDQSDPNNAEKITVAPAWFLILENSKMRVRWDILITILVMFYILAVPLRMSFRDTVPTSSYGYAFVRTEGGWLVFDLLSDVIFILDLIFIFFTTTRHKGHVVRDLPSIAKVYLR